MGVYVARRLPWLPFLLFVVGEDLAKCRQNSEAFLSRYHDHRPHLSLGLAPPLRRGGQALSDI